MQLGGICLSRSPGAAHTRGQHTSLPTCSRCARECMRTLRHGSGVLPVGALPALLPVAAGPSKADASGTWLADRSGGGHGRIGRVGDPLLPGLAPSFSGIEAASNNVGSDRRGVFFPAIPQTHMIFHIWPSHGSGTLCSGDSRPRELPHHEGRHQHESNAWMPSGKSAQGRVPRSPPGRARERERLRRAMCAEGFDGLRGALTDTTASWSTEAPAALEVLFDAWAASTGATGFGGTGHTRAGPAFYATVARSCCVCFSSCSLCLGLPPGLVECCGVCLRGCPLQGVDPRGIAPAMPKFGEPDLRLDMDVLGADLGDIVCSSPMIAMKSIQEVATRSGGSGRGLQNRPCGAGKTGFRPNRSLWRTCSTNFPADDWRPTPLIDILQSSP